MREIEASNRFYEENGGLYMTATLVTKLDTNLPERTQVTFILTGSKLVTNRYTDPLPFLQLHNVFMKMRDGGRALAVLEDYLKRFA